MDGHRQEIDDDDGGDDVDMDNLKDYIVRWGVTWMIIITVTFIYIILPVMIPYGVLRILEKYKIIRFGPAPENQGKETRKEDNKES